MRETVLWLLRGSEAATISDKCILFNAKIVYVGLRIILRIALGKERRAQLYNKRDLDFGTIWYKFYKIMKRIDGPLLKLKIPTYNFEFYCRNNKDDFTTMTIRENDIIDRFRPKHDDIVVDVGAHIGKYSIIASKYVGEKGKVVAIEAHPENYEMLNRNIKLNKSNNIIPLNYAVYSKETKIKLFLPKEELGYTIYNTVMNNRQNTREDKFIEVNANTLDNLLQRNGILQVNWIKIDVEGAEYEVLKGANTILSNSKDIGLLIEVHNMEDGKNFYKPIMDLMEKYNFRVEFENKYDSKEMHIILHKQVSAL